MKHLSVETITLALLGLIIHEMIKFMIRKKKDTKFSFSFWIKDNWMSVVLSVACTFSLLLMLDDITNYFNIQTEENSSIESILAFTFGYLNQSLIKNIIGIFKNIFSGKSNSTTDENIQ